MNFFRSKLGFFSVLLAVLVLAGTVWYCLTQKAETEEPDGTFVWNEICAEVANEQ